MEYTLDRLPVHHRGDGLLCRMLTKRGSQFKYLYFCVNSPKTTEQRLKHLDYFNTELLNFMLPTPIKKLKNVF